MGWGAKDASREAREWKGWSADAVAQGRMMMGAPGNRPGRGWKGMGGRGRDGDEGGWRGWHRAEAQGGATLEGGGAWLDELRLSGKLDKPSQERLSIWEAFREERRKGGHPLHLGSRARWLTWV